MNRHQIFTEYVRGNASEEETATKLGLSLRDWKFRHTKHGKKLPMILKTLDRIEKDEITRDNAAEILNVTTRQVNKLMDSWGVRRPIKEYVIERAVSTVKWEIRKRFAVEVIAGSSDYETAAENAQVSTRQMRRWVADLLKAHYGMTPTELRQLANHKRLRLADEIEAAEGLEIAKINVLNAVAKGEKTLQDVAIERVMARRSYKGKSNVRRLDRGGTQEGGKPVP